MISCDCHLFLNRHMWEAVLITMIPQMVIKFVPKVMAGRKMIVNLIDVTYPKSSSELLITFLFISDSKVLFDLYLNFTWI